MSSLQEKTYYPLDNDQEARRLADQHDLLKFFMGGRLIVAPIDLSQQNLRVLDSGTADGKWLLDLATSLSSPKGSTLVGTDVSSARFPTGTLPSPADISFAKQDIRVPWPENWKHSFDLVHQRLVLTGAGPDVSRIVHLLLGNVASGGWIQLTEAAQVIGKYDGPAMRNFLALMGELMRAMGTGDAFANELEQWVRDAGFVNVQSRDFPYDLGAKIDDLELREKSVRSTCTAVAGLVQWALQLPDGLKSLTRNELETLPSRFRQELDERGGSYPMRTVWGQRP
ncbi:S-adenosyl-L-methionine-dependent methyltransferase [Xylariaceae sp. FL0594]|nr:S-adenosyl-L-methionine-dependent methyltransferase [Xylariaceae sp. FL0594]